MNKTLRRIGVWWIIWILFSIVFVDYLPQHPHITYQVLISPFLLLLAIFAYPLEFLENSSFPTELIPGIGFWIITILLYFFPHKPKTPT